MMWQRPLGRGYVARNVGMLGFYYVVLLAIAYQLDLFTVVGWFLGIVTVATAVAIPAFRRRWGKVWRSVSATVRQPLHVFVPRLERALADGKVRFTPVTEERGSSLEMSWDQIYRLGLGGLSLHLSGGQRRTRVFLGPVGPHNRADVERVNMAETIMPRVKKNVRYSMELSSRKAILSHNWKPV